MMSNTRGNPTANGDYRQGVLHLGHAATFMLNHEIARSTGGKFVLRLDDNQAYWIKELGRDRIAANCSQIMREMDWLGIEPDEYVYQSEQESVVEAEIQRRRLFDLLDRDPVNGYPHVPEMAASSVPQYPYAPWLTAEVVILDHLSDIDLVIVGIDLLSRYSLYSNICERMGYAVPRQVFVPRLQDGTGGEIASVSKTVGNHRLRHYHDDLHWTPRIFKEFVAECYLVDPAKGWKLDNIKPNPLIK